MAPDQTQIVAESTRLIESEIERVWNFVTDVDVSAYRHPAIFRILGIPQPLRAELKGVGVGAERTAWFDNQKRFIQVVLDWRPPNYFRFTFTADPGFRAGYLFDLSSGPFRVLEGWYKHDENAPMQTRLTLGTRYLCAIHPIFVVPWIIRMVMPAYQRFLLRMIKANCEGRNG